MLNRLLFGCTALCGDRIGNLIRYSCPSRSGAENHHTYLGNVDPADVQGCHDGRQSHTSSPLDIVIEAGDMRTILVQEPSGIVQAEVFAALLSAYIPSVS